MEQVEVHRGLEVAFDNLLIFLLMKKQISLLTLSFLFTLSSCSFERGTETIPLKNTSS